MNTNDLVDFMESATKQMAEEYNRIQKRATEDPGTAGDQGEENWATLLRGWLPHIFHIVTKGRILDERGSASPQVDVIILKPEYPTQLLDKKLYLAGGVLAAFECKITLKSSHIIDFVKNSITVKGYSPNVGTPFIEIQSPILYGLLAHSHSWKKPNSQPVSNIQDTLWDSYKENVSHPFQMPDIVCVADLATWSAYKSMFSVSNDSNNGGVESENSKVENISAGYMCYHKEVKYQHQEFTPIGTLISVLYHKLSWRNTGLQSLSRYFDTVLLKNAEGIGRRWNTTIFSPEVRRQIESGQVAFSIWDDWSIDLS